MLARRARLRNAVRLQRVVPGGNRVVVALLELLALRGA
jgi:hypothetical protein